MHLSPTVHRSSAKHSWKYADRQTRIEPERHGDILDRHLTKAKLIWKSPDFDEANFPVERQSGRIMRKDPEIEPSEPFVAGEGDRLAKQALSHPPAMIERLDAENDPRAVQLRLEIRSRKVEMGQDPAASVANRPGSSPTRFA